MLVDEQSRKVMLEGPQTPNNMLGSIRFDDKSTKYQKYDFYFFMVLRFETFFDSKPMDFEVESHEKP